MEIGISIHAPREGGDPGVSRCRWSAGNFNPRPPRGGRRPFCGAPVAVNRISIHAPREGGDTFGMSMSLVTTDFNPRPPRGGRL